MDVALAPAGTVVASTKLHVPDGDGALVPRDGAFPQPLAAARPALVAAPRGLVAGWAAAQRERRVAWLSLDPEDADPVRLWRCAIAALRLLQPAFGADAEAMLAAGPAALAEAVVRLVAAEAALLGDPIMVVLDGVAALGERAVETLPSLTVWLDCPLTGSLLVVAAAPLQVAGALRAVAGDEATFAAGSGPVQDVRRTPG